MDSRIEEYSDAADGTKMVGVVSMADDVTVLALFTDIRGFTRWSEANEVFINLDSFISGFMEILHKRFKGPEFQIKPLGDGAMIVSHLPEEQNVKGVAKVLARTLTLIGQTNQDFRKHCTSFARRVGHGADLRLGWGVVRGKVIRIGEDWTGHNLSKCSRLCNEARPFGTVIDRDDFSELPREARGFVAQVRRLRGIGDVRVWVSAEIATQFVPREQLRETPEVHVAGTCFYEDRNTMKLLFARRAPDRSLFPGKLEGCGGQLRYSETFVEGIRRHYRQEFGLDVDVLPDFHNFYEIRVPNEPVIPGVRFLCRRVGTNEPSSANHTELMWISEGQFRNMPAEEFIEGLKHEVIELIEDYKRSTSQR
jgi:class 3 adenylate cyclase